MRYLSSHRLFAREICCTAARLFFLLTDKQHGLPNFVNFHIFNEAEEKHRSCASSFSPAIWEFYIFIVYLLGPAVNLFKADKGYWEGK